MPDIEALCGPGSQYLDRLFFSRIIFVLAETNHFAHNTCKASYNRHNFSPPRTFGECILAMSSARITHLKYRIGNNRKNNKELYPLARMMAPTELKKREGSGEFKTNIPTSLSPSLRAGLLTYFFAQSVT